MYREVITPTVTLCPKLQKLRPSWFHLPPIASAREKPKQSANPTKKAQSWTTHCLRSQKPCHMATTQARKSRLLRKLKRTVRCILCAKRATASPPTNSPHPSTMKAMKVSRLSSSASISPQYSQKANENSPKTKLIIMPEQANTKKSSFGILLSSAGLPAIELTQEISDNFCSSMLAAAVSSGNSLVRRQSREMSMLRESITNEQVFCPRGLMSAADSALPMMLAHWMMHMLRPKQLLLLPSRLPHQFTQLLVPLQQLESRKPQKRLPTGMMTVTHSENPTKRKTTEKLRKMFQPIAPQKIMVRYFHLPMQELQSPPSPEPRNSKAMLSSPTQWLPFCEANWPMMPRLALLIEAKSIATLEMNTTRLRQDFIALLMLHIHKHYLQYILKNSGQTASAATRARKGHQGLRLGGWENKKWKIMAQKQKQAESFGALTSFLNGASWKSDWMDLVEALLRRACLAVSLRMKNLRPVLRTICFSSRLGRSLTFLPLLLEAQSQKCGQLRPRLNAPARTSASASEMMFWTVVESSRSSSYFCSCCPQKKTQHLGALFLTLMRLTCSMADFNDIQQLLQTTLFHFWCQQLKQPAPFPHRSSLPPPRALPFLHSFLIQMSRAGSCGFNASSEPQLELLKATRAGGKRALVLMARRPPPQSFSLLICPHNFVCLAEFAAKICCPPQSFQVALRRMFSLAEWYGQMFWGRRSLGQMQRMGCEQLITQTVSS